MVCVSDCNLILKYSLDWFDKWYLEPTLISCTFHNKLKQQPNNNTTTTTQLSINKNNQTNSFKFREVCWPTISSFLCSPNWHTSIPGGKRWSFKTEVFTWGGWCWRWTACVEIFTRSLGSNSWEETEISINLTSLVYNTRNRVTLKTVI